ncbi:hypothetical protein DENIS_4094 [Desulfonema ishimotonii]|uniref:Uncharacterized protein n=1 Tax=Desulfonema ishimotonii TaxID=45657 RepID=A0A401G1L9_9BACT|nr:hypothetical protein [Desulfonema ishimotonii]GBC63105.1 hypothetical protein DENIS_4094 [Desulfonema ishimotonii]
MSQVLSIFSVGLMGVFLCMALLYGSMRFTALVIDALARKEEK